jgi:hypothetical protein
VHDCNLARRASERARDENRRSVRPRGRGRGSHVGVGDHAWDRRAWGVDGGAETRLGLVPSVAQVDAWSAPDFAGLRWAGFLLRTLTR